MAGGSYVGVDIGSNLIKVAEVRPGRNGLEVVALGVAPTPQEAFDNSMIVDANLLGQAVKNLIKQSGISTNQSVSSISGPSSVVVRVIDVPPMNEAELAEAMKWEVERQVPFPIEQLVADFQKIERPEGYSEGQNIEVLLAVAQQDVIDRHVEMLFAAGLKPKAIDVEQLAVGRTLLDMGLTSSEPGHAVIIVNIGASNTDVGIFRDRLLTFPRSIPLAGDNITRAIAELLQVDLATAENYKREVGEVLFDQMSPQANPFSPASPFETGGFVDFSQQDAPPPSAPTSSPSGRMPFDFSAAQEPPLNPPTAANTPFDFSTSAPEPEPTLGGLTPATPLTDFGAEASADTGAQVFGQPDGEHGAQGLYPPQDTPSDANLPVVTNSTGDPARDALRINVFNAMAPILAELVQEVRRSVEYYRTKTGDAPVHENSAGGRFRETAGPRPLSRNRTRHSDPCGKSVAEYPDFVQELLAEPSGRDRDPVSGQYRTGGARTAGRPRTGCQKEIADPDDGSGRRLEAKTVCFAPPPARRSAPFEGDTNDAAHQPAAAIHLRQAEKKRGLGDLWCCPGRRNRRLYCLGGHHRQTTG